MTRDDLFNVSCLIHLLFSLNILLDQRLNCPRPRYCGRARVP